MILYKYGSICVRHRTCPIVLGCVSWSVGDLACGRDSFASHVEICRCLQLRDYGNKGKISPKTHVMLTYSKKFSPNIIVVGRVAQCVYRLATGWTVRGSNPGGGEIFRTCPDRPWGPPSLLYNGYRVFLGGRKRPGSDADPSPPSSAEV
jgi:hypothetical protein